MHTALRTVKGSSLPVLSLLLTFLMMGWCDVGWGQSYLGLNGGYEGTATIDNSNTFTTGQVGKWTKANATQTISNETLIIRSGANSLKINNSSTTGRRLFTPTFSAISGQSLVIQYYRRSSSTANTQESQSMISLNGSANGESTSGTYSTVSSINTWEKVTYAPTSLTSATTLWAGLLQRQTGSGADLYIDDVAVYVATSVDNTAPNSPGTVTVAPNSTSPTTKLDVNWVAASGGVDNGGYIVVRYTATPVAADDPNINGIYAISNAVTVTNAGAVAYVGNATSFTDDNNGAGLSAGTTYYYKVYTYDKAYNYSTEYANTGTPGTTSNTGLLTPPTLTAASGATVDAPFDVTFTEDATWRAAITSVTVNGTALTAGYNKSNAGKITFTPSASAPANLLQTSGSKTIVISATGYTNAMVMQSIGAGVANKLAISTQPTAPATNGGLLASQPAVTIQDQYGNLTNSTLNVNAVETSPQPWTLSGTKTVAAVNGTATFTNLAASYTSAYTGASITFTANAISPAASTAFNIPAPAPANDLCANAVTLTVNNAAISGTTVSATVSSPFSGNTDVWYKLIPASSGTITITTAQSSQDIDLYVYTGANCPTSTSENFTGTNDGSLTSETVSINNAVAGTTYYIRVVYYVSANSTAGAFTIQATQIFTPPTLTAASSATVDAPFDITFTPNSNYEVAISGITIGGTALSSSAYTISSGKITFIPANSPLLQSSGSKTIIVSATGYSGNTVSQTINAGIATKLGITTQPTAPTINGGTLTTQPVVAVQDQYGNTIASSATVIATATQATWTLGGTTSKSASSGVATFTTLTATSTAAVNGASITFNSSGLTSVISNAFNIPAPIVDYISLITVGNAATENFDGMGTLSTATIPSGFKVSIKRTTDGDPQWNDASYNTTSTTQTATAGAAATAGGTYNWGNSSPTNDRSLGFLTSSNYPVNGGQSANSGISILSKIRNNTANTITSLVISFDYEKYRNGQNACDWTFFYNITGNSTWQAIAAGNQSYIADANNNPTTGSPITTSKTVTLSNINLANGADLYLRWSYASGGGNAQGIGIDNFSIAIPIDQSIANYRTKQAGNFNNNSTWEYNSYSSTWLAASAPPTSSNKITVQHALILDVDFDVTTTFTVSTGGSMLIAPSKTFSVAASGAADLGGKSITVQSNSSGTGRIGQIAGTLNNATNLTIERYIPAKDKRRWTFIASPVAQNIRNSWQQQIFITGQGTGGTPCGSGTGNGGATDKYNASGFDDTQNDPASMFTYNETIANGNTSHFTSIPNTISTSLTPGKGYRVNIRGDRTDANACANQLNYSGAAPAPGAVTLKATGAYYTPSVITLNDPAVHAYTLLGNPYPSEISFVAFKSGNSKINNKAWIYSSGSSSNNSDVYSVWNAGTITNAQFLPAANKVGTDPNYTDVVISSGGAFFVEANTAGTVSFAESNKTTNIASGNGVFSRVAAPWTNYIRIHLNKDAGGIVEEMDNIVVRFKNDATVDNAKYGALDAYSLNTVSSSIASLKAGSRMAIQTRRLDFKGKDTINLAANAAAGNYRLSFTEYEQFTKAAYIYLIDNYLHTITNVKQQTGGYAFSITADTASQGNKRFAVVFSTKLIKTTNTAAVRYSKVEIVNPVEQIDTKIQFGLYPNPVHSELHISVGMHDYKDYHLQILSATGAVIIAKEGVVKGGTIRLSTSALAQGTYIARLYVANGICYTQKFVKQ